jgi:hypothetical protein
VEQGSIITIGPQYGEERGKRRREGRKEEEEKEEGEGEETVRYIPYFFPPKARA